MLVTCSKKLIHLAEWLVNHELLPAVLLVLWTLWIRGAVWTDNDNHLLLPADQVVTNPLWNPVPFHKLQDGEVLKLCHCNLIERALVYNAHLLITDDLYQDRQVHRCLYVGILGATDYWFRFEWQHCGSPHIHGIAWFPNAPDMEKLLATDDDSDLIAVVEDITSYADDVVSTINPAIAMDGSNPETAPPPKTKPQHSCNKPYSEVEDFSMDLISLPPANVKPPATSHHHHHRERRPQPHHCKK